MPTHVILVMKTMNTELHQATSVHAKQDIMKNQQPKHVLLATTHVKLALNHPNVIPVKITEKENTVLAQPELTMMVRVQLNVSNVTSNVKNVLELLIIVTNVLATESVNLNVTVHQEL